MGLGGRERLGEEPVVRWSGLRRGAVGLREAREGRAFIGYGWSPTRGCVEQR